MKVENITLSVNPSFELIRSYFGKTDNTCRAFTVQNRTVKANRKIVIQHNQLKSNYLHIYIRNKRLNCWVHYVETKDGNFQSKDYSGPDY